MTNIGKKLSKKERSLYLHIGMHKTGSTLLQDVVFPSLGVHVIKQPDWGQVFRYEGYHPRSLQNDVSIWERQAGARKLVVSQEWLSGSAEGNPIWSWKRAAKRLKEAFPEARVLIVLREQLDYILSIYAFRVLIRGLEHRDLNQYLNDIFDDWLYQKFQYDEFVGQYLELFGSEQVTVLLYEYLTREPEHFIRHIYKYLEIPDTKVINLRRINESPKSLSIINHVRRLNYGMERTFNMMLRMRIHNRILSVTRKWYFRWKKNIFLPALGRHYNNSLQLSIPENWRIRISAAVRVSNARLAEMIRIDVSRYGYII